MVGSATRGASVGGAKHGRWRSGVTVALVGGLTFVGSAYQAAPARTADGYLGRVTTGATTTDPVVAVAGDIACPAAYPPSVTKCQQMATSDLLLAMNPDAVLTVGDNQYETGLLDDFQRAYGPSWGRVLDRTFPVPGNHEYDSPGATGYYSYFGTRAGDPAKGYYSFDLGAWHMIALNSECGPVGGCQAGSPQEAWLRADLAAHPAACTLAYWHKPRFSSGKYPSNVAVQPLWQALWDGHADVVLSGHSHHYERFAPQAPDGVRDDATGIRQFIVGTGGRNLQLQLNPPLPNTEARQNTSFGVLKLVLHGTSYDWQFVPTGGGTFTDSGSRACGGHDSQPPTAPANLTATASSSSRVDLSWSASTDNVGVTGYRVYRDDALVATTGGTQTTYVDTVGPATTATYEVSAVDAAGRESPRSNPATVTTPPVPPGVTRVFAPTDDAYVEQGAPNTNLGADSRLIVDASPTDNLLLRFDVATGGCAITSAKLRLTVGSSMGDGSTKGGAFSTTMTSGWSESTVTWANAPPANSTVVGTLAAVSPGQTYEVDVSSAVTADGPLSLRAVSTSSSAARYVSKEGSATIGPQLVVTCRQDSQPPTAPADLTGTATSSSRVDMSWSASTDDVGVTGYRVYRDNALVATTGGTQMTYADTGVAAATTYTYAVSAIDAAGHESPRSNSATVTTPPSPGLTYVFAATDDAYVDQTAPSTNFGAAPRLIVDASPTDNLLLRFDVATAGCAITSAKLRLTVGAGSGDGSLKGGAFSTVVTTVWSESTVTWANAPAANPSVVGSLGAVSPGQTYEVDVSAVVIADGPVSLRAGSTSSGAARYVSKEGSATLGPQLVVTCA
jgi:chitodextrinase